MDNNYNLLFICSDQHNRYMAGCYGNDHVITPAIDSLAADGTVFTNAYSVNPICVPARACLATGCLSHEIHCWDNASPYVDKMQALSYGHQLERVGIPVTTIGKLHYRSPQDDTGFPDQRIPLHVRDGVGDLFGTIREYGVEKHIMREQIPLAHAGDSSYIRYDTQITRQAVSYLDEKKNSREPWCLYVGYTFPHLPFISPQETWDLYNEADIPMPYAYRIGERAEHRSCQDIRNFFGLQEEYDDADIRRALHAYYGMCSFLDIQIGRLLAHLKQTGLYERTYVIYTSDHGEMMGNHGLWFKNSMLEDSVGIPMIVSGPGLPKGAVNRTVASLVDLYPTILDMMRVTPVDDGKRRTGISLLPLIRNREGADRAAFSEFHASASYTGGFMVRYRQYKYIYYNNYEPQLFDLQKDPHELRNLAGQEAYRHVEAVMRQKLWEFGDPDGIEALCRSDQKRRLDQYGGKDHIRNDFKPIIFSPPPVP